MNLDPLENFFERATDVKLDEKKKDVMHQELLLFMKKNPIKSQPIKKSWLDAIFFGANTAPFKTATVALASLMLFLVVGGIVSVKASSALPGDLLYGVKVGVNEKLQETFAFSDKAKLNINIKLAETRIQEAEQLTVQGGGNSITDAKVNSNFNDHVAAASHYITKLTAAKNNKGAEAAGASFEASLKAQSIIMHGLKKSPDNTALENSITNAASQISNLNINVIINAGASGNTPEKEKRIRQKITDVQNSVNNLQKSIDNNRETIGQQAASQSEGNLNLVQQKINEGTTHLSGDGHDWRASASSLHQASVIAQESKDLLDTKTHLKVNVPINISDSASDTSPDTTGSDNQNNNHRNGNHDSRNSGLPNLP